MMNLGANKVVVTYLMRSLYLCGWLSMVFSPGLAAEQEGTIGYAQERYNPAPVYTGPVRTGQQVYDYACKTCHDRTTQGAPLPNDDVEWRMRADKGMSVLMKHVKEGYKELMPENGGCRNCSDAELHASILYILEASGVKPIYLDKDDLLD